MLCDCPKCVVLCLIARLNGEPDVYSKIYSGYSVAMTVGGLSYILPPRDLYKRCNWLILCTRPRPYNKAVKVASLA